jgi:PPOX class probable F420-dependent enzyme
MTSESISDEAWTREAAAQRFRGKYLSIATYRRDVTLVATPVWFVEQDGRLLVETDSCSGKVKRIRRDLAVRIALCTASGKFRGDQVPGLARLLPDSEPSVEQLIKRKYRADLLIIAPLRVIQSWLHPGRPRSTPVILSITAAL